MSAPIALQLYTLREALAREFHPTLEKIADLGYIGVETAGFPEGIAPRQAKKWFDELGLTVTSAHSMLPLGEDREQVLETMAAIECTRLVCPWMFPEFYQSVESIHKLAETFNQADEVCREHGLQLFIHNHDFEFQLVGQVPAIQILRQYLAPSISFELDTYWAYVAGHVPAKVVKEFGPRAPLLHIKDGPGTREEPMLALGEGVLDIPAIIKAGGDNTTWLIVELDECASDMLSAVEKSYHYLTTRRLALGKV